MSLIRPARGSAATARRRASLIKHLAVGLLLLVLAACSGEPGTEAQPSPGSTSGSELAATVASYDLAVGTQRLTVGLFTSERELIGWGDVDFRLAYLGTRDEQTEGEIVAEETAAFLPIASASGEAPEPREGPAIVPAAEVKGVYAAEVQFDRAGFWGVEVTAQLDGEPKVATAAFEVHDEHQYPWVGEQAPRTENLTLDSADAPRKAIDSRAGEDGPVPDEILHTTTVADSIQSGTPTLLVISTPVYCVSRFCGPITEMVAGLAEEYSGVANFVHIEVWRDFEGSVVNRAAAEWGLSQGVPEPWVYLIDAGGTITHRWDNVATRGEIEPALQAL